MADFVIRDKDRICGICIAEGATLTTMTAAGELARYLTRQSGLTPVVHIGKPQQGEICLGADNTACAEEELRIVVKNGVLHVDGGKRGILYGVYELLEQLGFRFLTADCDVIPENTVLAVPEDIGICQKPLFEYRCTSWKTADAAMAPKLRLNAVLEGKICDAFGGGVTYEGGFVHTLGDLAEMGKINGEYTDRQPCLTDEKTFETVAKNIRKILEKNPDARIISVSQNDSHPGIMGCQCENCRAIDEAEGTPMGSLLAFVNRVADVFAKEYPNLAIDTLSYSYTQKTTEHMNARDNVIIRLCASGRCVINPLEVDDPDFTESLHKWADHSKRIYIWNYTTNFQSYHNPFPNLNILRHDVRLFAENNVKGVFEQGNSQTVNGEFGALRAYLFGKLLWDPYMSEETYQQHINDFLAGYYGKGWKHIRSFIDRLHAPVEGGLVGVNFVDPSRRFVGYEEGATRLEKSVSFLAKAREDFAAALAEANENQRARIATSEVQLDLYEWYVRFNEREALDKEDPAYAAATEALRQAGIKLYSHVMASGITLMYEDIFGRTVFLKELPEFTAHPFTWGCVMPDTAVEIKL